MIQDCDLSEISPKKSELSTSSTHISSGIPILKSVRVTTFSPDEWELFIEEWATSLHETYKKTRRYGGSGDLGVDIAGFLTTNNTQGDWDNYQCKQYDHPLYPTDAWPEIGKIIYYSFLEKYTPPRKHYFICPKGIGTTLEQLLNNPEALKVKAEENWEKYCLNSITSTKSVPLTGDLRSYFDEFDFSIFTSKSTLELIEGHSKTNYHAVRFGGGLPPRPSVEQPPSEPTQNESRYLRHLLDAFGENMKQQLDSAAPLDDSPKLKANYLRQRERFYHAEGLRNFARDTVPEGTFESLQEEIFQGVIDTNEASYSSGLDNLKSTLAQASKIPITANPLSASTKVQDKQGVCHQLANQDRLMWINAND